MKEKQKSYPAVPLQPVRRVGDFLGTAKKPWLTRLAAFFLPILLMQILWAILGVRPFGTQMILAHDQWHQYYPFFVNFRERIQSGHSLFYSWNTGMGTNYLSLYAYYLASPLNWPVLILPDELVLYYYMLITLVKIGCAGLFFQIFLEKTFSRCEPAQAFFSTMFALCAFIMGYSWNSIWLDTVAMLPLVALGTLQLLQEKRFVLYVVSLALAVLFSYYIGLFLCFFVLLLFLGYNFCRWDDFPGFLSRLLRIAFYSLLALGLTAILTAPALLGLLSTSSVENEFPKELAFNITTDTSFAGLLGALAQIFGNAGALIEPTTMIGLPNIYCGVTSLLLAMLYCCCKRIPVREKIFSCFLLVFFAVSFVIRQLDYVWHGFHFPNMLPYRFSFLFSFVVLFMAYRAFTQLDRFRWYHLLLILPVLGLFVYCVVTTQDIGPIIATAVLLLAGVTLLALYGAKRCPRSVLTLGLCILLLVEAVASASLGAGAVGTTDSLSYPNKETDSKAVIAEMYKREENPLELWRAEFSQKQTLNDSTLFSLPGVSVFSSACNSKVAAVLDGIGLGAWPRANRYIYEQSDPAVNLLLGVKYLIDREGAQLDPAHFTPVASSGDVLLLENNRYLPVGWVVSTQALGFDPEQEGTPFARLESLYGSMLGVNLTLYQPILPGEVSYAGTAEGATRPATYYTFTSEGEDEARMSIVFTATRAGGMSIWTKTSNAGSAYLYVNDEYRCYYDDRYGALRYVSGLNAGDRVTIRYRVKDSAKKASVTIHAAMFDEETFRSTYETLRAHKPYATQHTDTELAWITTVHEERLFFTTIPYDSGWQATVDGEPARITPVAGAFVALHLSEGRHEICLRYETPGFAVGRIVSFASLAVFLVLVALYLFFRLTRRPMVKVSMEMAGMPAEQDAPDEPEQEAEPQPVAGMPQLDRESVSDETAVFASPTQKIVLPEDLNRPPEEPPFPEDETQQLLDDARRLTEDVPPAPDQAQRASTEELNSPADANASASEAPQDPA